MRVLTLVVAVMLASPALAQEARQPIPFAGDLYYPACAVTFFNANQMVRTGFSNGTPLYVDTTLEPYSVIYVPIGRGQVQPYERRRAGALAGTTGSRMPSFPNDMTSESITATPTDAISVAPLAADVAAATPVAPMREVVGTTGVLRTPRSPSGPALTTLRHPESNDGLWVRFLGEKWVSAGAAVPFAPERFTHVGEYGIFPVFAKSGLKEDVIYIPTRAGLVAPYRLKE